MDQIQKVLIKAGRKDLAQKYYKKVAQKQNPVANLADILLVDRSGQGKEFIDKAEKIGINQDDAIEILDKIQDFTMKLVKEAVEAVQ